jgi:glycosyltransferase involved in cell wall biosynthesis
MVALSERDDWQTGMGLPAFHPEHGWGISLGDEGMQAGWDIAVVKLLMASEVPGKVRAAQDAGQMLVADVDDFHFGIHADNMAARSTHPHTNRESNRFFYEQTLRAVDRVIVSTPFLADWYSARCRDVRVCRNGIDVDRWQVKAQQDWPTFGWVGATPWRSNDIETLAEWLPQFVRDKRVEVHHSGHLEGDPLPFAVRAGLRDVSTAGMVPILELPSLFQYIDVGLVPLAVDPFNDAKSCVKGLEYAAAGIPFIAAAAPEYVWLAEQGVGRVARTPDEWRDHALELLDPDVRVEEAARQRAIVEDQFNLSRVADAWAGALS